MGMCCDKFKPYTEMIDRAIFLATAHGHVYEGDPFEYCPWCGANLWGGQQ